MFRSNPLLCASSNLGRNESPNREARRTQAPIAGTTLIEVLVVIVIFAVGILAVMQIFPKGLQVLMRTREASVATNLARDESERLKARADQLPDQIVAGHWDTAIGGFRIDSDRSPNDLGPRSNGLNQDGTLAGYPGISWQHNSGPNVFRVVLGEGGQVPSPTWVGSNLFGGVRILQFSPIAVPSLADYDPTNPPLVVYGQDMVKRTGAADPQAQRTGNEYYVTGAGSSLALSLPTGPTTRWFRIFFTAYLSNGKTVNLDVSAGPLAATTPDPYGNYPLSTQPYSLASAMDYSSVYGATFVGAEFDSIRVARKFQPIADPTAFSDPYQYCLIDPSLGVLLFSPTPSNEREPLQAKVDYEVLDWRILTEEFRVSDAQTPQYRLAIGNLKVGNQAGPDGLPNPAIWFNVTNSAFGAVNDDKADNFLVQDMVTGGILAEKSLNGGVRRLAIDKSLGIITFYDADENTPGVQAELLTPGASNTTLVDLTNRPLRALYEANGEWSVQPLKGATVYSPVYSAPSPGTYYVGKSNGTVGLPNRIYFSKADAGRRVTVDELYVVDAKGRLQSLYGQTFQIGYSNPPDPTGLPMIDVTSVVPGGSFYLNNAMPNGYAVRGVRGASIAVRVLHNPATFNLTSNSADNIRRLDQWGRNWSRRTVETYIQREDEVK